MLDKLLSLVSELERGGKGKGRGLSTNAVFVRRDYTDQLCYR